MYKLVALSLLAACELQPPPPKPAPAPAPSAPTPTPQPPAPTTQPPQPGSGSGSGSAAPKPPVQITPACLTVAEHVAGVIISSAEPAQRSIFEGERDRIVRSTGEVCTIQGWSEAANKCYLAATTQVALKACESKFPPPQQPRPQPPVTVPANPPHGGMHAEPGAAGSAAPH